MRLRNGYIQADLHPPDPETGFYRGTRFDWAGMMGDLNFAGHNFHPKWFDSVDPTVRDFVYRGPDIIAGPCTAATGPAEEFLSQDGALGYGETTAGGTFVKIGVGILRKPDDTPYDRFRLYEIVNPGNWEVVHAESRAEFTQTVADPSSGYAYVYRKNIILPDGKPRLILSHSLTNTGREKIDTHVYNHNFNYLDRRPPDSGVVVSFPFTIRSPDPPDVRLAEIRGKRVVLKRRLSGEDRVQCLIEGFEETPGDYDVRVEHRDAGIGVRITSDRPPARMYVWAIRAAICVEPYIHMTLSQDAEFTWNITYDYYHRGSAAPAVTRREG